MPVSKRSALAAAAIILAAMILPGCSAAVGTTGPDDRPNDEPAYAQAIFSADIIDLDILADPVDWQEMLDHATDEAYIKVDVVVNGTTFHDVGIRPKGNSSLTQVAQTDSDRFSFRLKFDEYVEGQTCFGLDSFVINNMFGDNTYLKEYISYDLMRTIGVDCPCFGFAGIKVNGETWGLYLAVEAYNDSYELRVSGDDSGNLYNVKISMELPQGGNGPAAGLPGGQRPDSADGQSGPTADGNPGGRPNPGGMGAGSTGGSLVYTDDDPDSYPAIFSNAVGDVTDADEQKVIAALKALSTGTDLENYFDVDAILRYLAAHTLVVNLDSYSSMMAQNFYLYETDGKITVLPWDYNLAWGGFQNSSASDVVNFPIDTPVSGVEMSDRPLIGQLLADSGYLETYHQYLQELVDSYFASGRFAARIEQMRALIADDVQADPTAFCTFEDFEKAVTVFTRLGELRAQSVQGQLDGGIPSTTAGQQADPDSLVKSDSVNLQDLGTMGRGLNPGMDPGQVGPGRR